MGNADIKVVRVILTLYSDSQLQIPIKSKVFTELADLPTYIVYCGLDPNTTYFYTVEVVRSYKYRFSTYEYSVISSGYFTTGYDGSTVVEEKPLWEEEGCILYSVVVSWDFVLSQIMPPDSDCGVKWFYAFNDGDFIPVSDIAKSHRTIIISREVAPEELTDNSVGESMNVSSELAEHIELRFDNLSGDKKFTVRGILTCNETPSIDYEVVLDNLFWEDFNNIEG